MNTQFWLTQAFNGISYGALLFLVGSGLSLIFGVMRIVNLSHGSYFLLGGYVALSVIWTTGSWLLAIPVAALTIALVGVAMERVFLRPLGFDPLRQVLLTVGFAFLFQQAALDIWTGNNFDINPPDALTKSIVVGGLYLPLYRIFMIATALIIGVVLWLAMGKGRVGAPETLEHGEIVVFEPGEAAVEFVAHDDVEFVIGSAVPHPHDLVLGQYSVHTSRRALQIGEAHIQHIRRSLIEQGRL